MNMSMKRASLFQGAALGAVLVLAGTAVAQSANTSVGLWKGNMAKSHASPGTESKSTTSKMEAAGAGVKVTVDATSADGTPQHWQFTANYDGKDNPITGNSPWGDTVALTR